MSSGAGTSGPGKQNHPAHTRTHAASTYHPVCVVELLACASGDGMIVRWIGHSIQPSMQGVCWGLQHSTLLTM